MWLDSALISLPLDALPAGGKLHSGRPWKIEVSWLYASRTSFEGPLSSYEALKRTRPSTPISYQA